MRLITVYRPYKIEDTSSYNKESTVSLTFDPESYFRNSPVSLVVASETAARRLMQCFLEVIVSNSSFIKRSSSYTLRYVF